LFHGFLFDIGWLPVGLLFVGGSLKGGFLGVFWNPQWPVPRLLLDEHQFDPNPKTNHREMMSLDGAYSALGKDC